MSIAEAGVRRRYPPGAVIFSENDASDCAYIVETGAVEISSQVNGERKLLVTLGPGEMFGEMAALDGTNRSATATAVSDTECILIHEDALRSRVEEAEPVLRLLLRVIRNRFRREQHMFRHAGLVTEDVIFRTDADFQKSAIDKIKLESELRGALSRQEFFIHYQPIVMLSSGEIESFEALIRWQHPQLGLVSPQKFIGLAEETALIVPIGLWVLETACESLLRFQDSAGRPVKMSINVSGRQFSEPSFLDELAEVIAKTGVDAGCLKLEITESVLMDYRSEPLGWIEKCKSLGTAIALDDFGTGFSSLSHLLSFPIDILKIDRCFVRAMGQDDKSLMMVRFINQLAHMMGSDVVAEGIEETHQRDALLDMSCEFGQGYLFSKPVSFDDAMALVPFQLIPTG